LYVFLQPVDVVACNTIFVTITDKLCNKKSKQLEHLKARSEVLHQGSVIKVPENALCNNKIHSAVS
jgi:hypothetical protein